MIFDDQSLPNSVFKYNADYGNLALRSEYTGYQPLGDNNIDFSTNNFILSDGFTLKFSIKKMIVTMYRKYDYLVSGKVTIMDYGITMPLVLFKLKDQEIVQVVTYLSLLKTINN